MERTPPKSPKIFSASDPNLNVTKRGNTKRIRLEEDVEPNRLEQFKCEIMDIFTTMISPLSERLQCVEKGISEIKKQNLDIKASNIDIEKSITFLSNQIIDFERKIDRIEKEQTATKTLIADLEQRNEILELTMRKTSIELRNVPKRKKESKLNILSSVTTLMKTINFESSATEITDVYRLPSNAQSTTSTIIVEFNNMFTKEDFLKKTKRYNNEHKTARLNSLHLGFEGTPTAIYFSEHMTSRAKRLYFLAREFAQSEKYKYCWTTNGRIFLEKKKVADTPLLKMKTPFKNCGKRSSMRKEIKVNINVLYLNAVPLLLLLVFACKLILIFVIFLCSETYTSN